MDNSKFLKSVIIVLLLINIGTLAFLWLHKPHDMNRGGGHGAFEFLTHELKLNEQQRQQYEELKNEHHEAVEALQEHSQKLRHSFFELLGSADSSAVNSLADSIAAYQKQIE